MAAGIRLSVRSQAKTDACRRAGLRARRKESHAESNRLELSRAAANPPAISGRQGCTPYGRPGGPPLHPTHERRALSNRTRAMARFQPASFNMPATRHHSGNQCMTPQRRPASYPATMAVRGSLNAVPTHLCEGTRGRVHRWAGPHSIRPRWWRSICRAIRTNRAGRKSSSQFRE